MNNQSIEQRIADTAYYLFYIEEQEDTLDDAVRAAARELITELGPCIAAALANGWEEEYANDSHDRDVAHQVLDSNRSERRAVVELVMERAAA